MLKQERSLEHRLLEVIRLCETFGNASTGRNANASRHCRYLKLYFSNGKIAACHINHFLLERIRVIKQFPDERSFHIFYQILTNRKICEACLLERDPNKYDYISQAETRFQGLDDSDEFKHTDKALTLLGFTDTERLNIYKTCAGILYLGQVRTKSSKNSGVTFADNEVIRKVCQLFGVKETEFTEAVLKSSLNGKTGIQRFRTEEQILSTLSNLACITYSLMFSWIISKFNTILNGESVQDHNVYIGLLDASGYERYPYNTYERFWINLVNEKIQQFYNYFMFAKEQHEYKSENLQWEFIDFGQNVVPCLDLIEMVDRQFTSILLENLQKSREFVMLHYNGEVRYSIDDWVEKNRSFLDEGLTVVLSGDHAKSFMHTLWNSRFCKQIVYLSCNKREDEFWTLNKQYTDSITEVLKDLNNTAPHFIRCIMPNDLKQSAVFDGTRVLNQLSSSGIVETLRILRKGFPDRMKFSEFRRRYAIIAAVETTEISDKDAAQEMLNILQQKGLLESNQFNIGHTKIFFKYGLLPKLEKQREAALSNTVICLQSACRSYLSRLHYLSLDKERCAIITIQRNVLIWTRKQTCQWLRLYFHLNPLIPLLRAKNELVELRERFQEVEKEKSLAVEAQTMLIKQVKKEHDKAEINILKFDKERQQYHNEKMALIEELDQLKARIDEVNRNNEELAKKNEELNRLTDVVKASSEKNERSGQVGNEDHQLTLSKLKVIGEELKRKKEAEAVQKANIETITEENKRLKKEIKKIMAELAKKQENETVNSNSEQQVDKKLAELAVQHYTPEIITSELESPGTSGVEEPKISCNLENEEMNELRRKCERLENTLLELQKSNEEYRENLDSTTRTKDQLTKAKKKIEHELQQLSECNQRLMSEKSLMEENWKKSETEILHWKSRLNHDADLIAKLQANTKKLIARIEELESELQAEQHRRLRAEKQRDSFQEELSVVNEQIYETNGQLDAQVQINKLRQIEV
uniref:Myosin motor domain-containing protein n=1 Tax=Syphacia muris TaxID=451379 RepID=A0A0N5A8U7_9BILA